MNADIIVVGAGLSGLAAALRLQQAGLRPLVVEAADRPGGRIATDRVDGFLLDRGFQVLQTWYPEARRVFDYPALDLRPFHPGALIRLDGQFHRVSDVWRRPLALPEMLASPVGTLADKLRLLRLRRRAMAGDLDALYHRPETSAPELLRRLGFSQRIIDRFFKPFFAGVFFEPGLDVSSRAFEFVFRAFACGDTALPAGGMDQLPAQLAARLAPGTIRFGACVERLIERGVILAGGETLRAAGVTVATDGNEAAALLGTAERVPTRGTTCLYFAAPDPPVAGPYLVLNATGRGPVNSLLCPSTLSAAYAPPGQALVTVNCFGLTEDPEQLEQAVRRQLTDWYGEAVGAWRRIALYRIRDALPRQAPPVSPPTADAVRAGERLWVCGERVAPPSIHWALASGRLAAADAAAALGAEPSAAT